MNINFLYLCKCYNIIKYIFDTYVNREQMKAHGFQNYAYIQAYVM